MPDIASDSPAPVAPPSLPQQASPPADVLALSSPGWKTSEFWLKGAALLLTALYLSDVIPTGTEAAKIAAVIATMLSALGYAVCRTFVKMSEARAIGQVVGAQAGAALGWGTVALATRKTQAGSASVRMLAMLASLALGFSIIVAYSACTKVQLAKMSGAFATCAKADLGQVVAGHSRPLLGDVAAIIDGNAPTLEADLAALAISVGIDSVKCAIVAVQAVIEPATSAHPNTSARAPGLARAIAWSAS